MAIPVRRVLDASLLDFGFDRMPELQMLPDTNHTFDRCPQQKDERRFMNVDQQGLIDAWKAMPKIDNIPTWSVEGILQHSNLAPDMMVLEIRPDDGATVLFQGSRSVERVGNDFTGKDYMDTPYALNANEMYERSRVLLSIPCGSIADFRILNRDKNQFLYSVSTLALPFRNKAGNPWIIQNFVWVTELSLSFADSVNDQSIDDSVTLDTPIDLGFGVRLTS